MSRVILIMIDGCRPEVLGTGRMPNVESIMENGSYTLKAETVTPSVTLPAHFSIFTSLKPLDHNVLTNTAGPTVSPSAKTIMELARYAGKTTAMFYCWEQLRNLNPAGSLDWSVFISERPGVNTDSEVAVTAGKFIGLYHPDVCFVYLHGADAAGHLHGWMSDPYLKALENADSVIGNFLESLNGTQDQTYNLIIQSDHGGLGHHHSEPSPETLTIPWIAMGPYIRKGHSIEQKVTVLDTAPTMARLLGIPLHYGWDGSPVDEILLDQQQGAVDFPAMAKSA
jgi:arylsulfatase A-like enzyme